MKNLLRFYKSEEKQLKNRLLKVKKNLKILSLLRITVFILTAIAIYLFFLVRTRQYRKTQNLLKSEVNKQTATIQEQTLALKSSLTQKETLLKEIEKRFEDKLNESIQQLRGRVEESFRFNKQNIIGLKRYKTMKNIRADLKKMKIAYALSSDDMLDLFKSVEVNISKEKLSCLFRKEGHKSYKYSRDVYLIGFLKALENRELS